MIFFEAEHAMGGREQRRFEGWRLMGTLTRRADAARDDEGAFDRFAYIGRVSDDSKLHRIRPFCENIRTVGEMNAVTRALRSRGSGLQARMMASWSEAPKLPDLPYDYGALEPVVNAEIMTLHHKKHHQVRRVHGAGSDNLYQTIHKCMDILIAAFMIYPVLNRY